MAHGERAARLPKGKAMKSKEEQAQEALWAVEAAQKFIVSVVSSLGVSLNEGHQAVLERIEALKAAEKHVAELEEENEQWSERVSRLELDKQQSCEWCGQSLARVEQAERELEAERRIVVEIARAAIHLTHDLGGAGLGSVLSTETRVNAERLIAEREEQSNG